jgi:L-threonylcarbamoyladenylate synthase
VITPDQAATLERCIAAGGVALFGADTVYGLACDPGDARAVERLYAIKGRPPAKPAAVLFFSLELALGTLPELGERTVAGLEGLMPGAVTALLPNPAARYPLAAGPQAEPTTTLGLRVPALGPATAALGAVHRPVLQSSANPSGGADARRVADIPSGIRDAVDLVLDAGELDGTSSTVIDLRDYEQHGRWTIVREGALSAANVAHALDGL